MKNSVVFTVTFPVMFTLRFVFVESVVFVHPPEPSPPDGVLHVIFSPTAETNCPAAHDDG